MSRFKKFFIVVLLGMSLVGCDFDTKKVPDYVEEVQENWDTVKQGPLSPFK
jgi:hypothetical protein